MTLRIDRGPLDRRKNQTILAHYNRLTSSRIPMVEFVHWVQNSPEGPAWHAILENEAGEIVGHTALIPLRGQWHGRNVLAGKAEYAFILEEYQSAKIDGFEKLGKPRNAIMIRQLFDRCKAAGFGPMLISTNAAGQRSLWFVGMTAIEIPVWECLLVLRPWSAAHTTPNLHHWQRIALWFVGIFQNASWTLARLFNRTIREVSVQPANNAAWTPDLHGLSFFQDSDSLSWRYAGDQYEQLTDKGSGLVILKKGLADRYLRVCEWRLDDRQMSFGMVSKMIERAKEQNAMGLRWAVYGNDRSAIELTRGARKLGFLVAGRTRRLLIYSPDRDFLSSDEWRLTDGMFSFDP